MEIYNVKLYRAVPVVLFGEYSTNQVKQPYVEDFYAHAGYLKRSTHRADSWGGNSIADHIKNDGKYFSFFPEHAIQIGTLMYKHEVLLKIIEYSFPEELAFKLVGNGYYSEITVISPPETVIEYDDIPGQRLYSHDFSKKEKIAMIKESLKETFKRIQTLEEFKMYHGLSDDEIFNDLCKNDFVTIITNSNPLKSVLRKNVRLIKAPDNIVNSWTISTKHDGSCLNNNQVLENNYEYLLNNDLKLALNEKAEELRNRFNDAIKSKRISEARSLLLKYHSQSY